MWIAALAAVTQEGFIQPFRNISRLCWMGKKMKLSQIEVSFGEGRGGGGHPQSMWHCVSVLQGPKNFDTQSNKPCFSEFELVLCLFLNLEAGDYAICLLFDFPLIL